VSPPGPSLFGEAVWKSGFLSIRTGNSGRELAYFENAEASSSNTFRNKLAAQTSPVGVLPLRAIDVKCGAPKMVGPSGYWEFSICDNDTGRIWECGCTTASQRADWISSLQRFKGSNGLKPQAMKGLAATAKCPDIQTSPSTPAPFSGHHGYVWKKGEWNTGFRERYFVVEPNGSLCQYFENQQAFQSKMKPKGQFVLATAK
jgi:hypothetical protein